MKQSLRSPVDGVKSSFHQGDHRVDAYVCFQCDYLAVSVDGQAARGQACDEFRPTLLRASKAAFPDDAVIQSLTD
jgi:hypothetical protein